MNKNDKLKQRCVPYMEALFVSVCVWMEIRNPNGSNLKVFPMMFCCIVLSLECYCCFKQHA